MQTTLNPTFGNLEILAVTDMDPTDMQVDAAIEMVVSGGIVTPEVTDEMDNESQVWNYIFRSKTT